MALEPITRQEQIIAGKDLQPITRMERFLKEYGGGDGSGGVTSWNDLTDKPFQHKRYTIEYAASDLTPSDDATGYNFVASEEKQTEVLNLLAELSALTTIHMIMSVSVPGTGEVMRLPVLFATKNDAMGTNGNIASCSFEGTGGECSEWNEVVPKLGVISVYKGGMTVLPENYYQAIGALGVVITLDVLHL